MYRVKAFFFPLVKADYEYTTSQSQCVIWHWRDAKKDILPLERLRGCYISPELRFNCPSCFKQRSGCVTVSAKAITCFVTVKREKDKYKLKLEDDNENFMPYCATEAGCWFRCKKCDPVLGFLYRTTEKLLVKVFERLRVLPSCLEEIVIQYCGGRAGGGGSNHTNPVDFQWLAIHRCVP